MKITVVDLLVNNNTRSRRESSKFKTFVNLSRRQKRRRLSNIIRRQRDLNSTSFDDSKNELTDFSTLHSASDDDEEQNHQIIEEQGTEDRNSKEEDKDEEEEGIGEDSEEVDDSHTNENDNTNSSTDCSDDNVLQNRDEMMKKALKNAFLSTNLKSRKRNT